MSPLRRFIQSRLPVRDDIILASSMTVFLVFSWAVRALLFNVPAFLLSYRLEEILVIAAYMLAVAFLESLLTILILLFLAILLPGLFLRNGFAYKASFLLLALGLVSIHMQFVMTNQPKPAFLLRELFLALALWLIPVLLANRIADLRKIALDILDRLTIFSYLYLPLGLISVVVVIFRLLW